MDELRKELKRLEEPKAWGRELTAAHKIIARDVAGKARTEAESIGGPARHFARAIRGYGSQTSARIGIGSAGKNQRNWGANAAFYGALGRSGWNLYSYTRPKPGQRVRLRAIHSWNPQHTDWVGASWGIALGQGPVAIVDTIVRETPHIIDKYGTAIEDITRRAFPD